MWKNINKKSKVILSVILAIICGFSASEASHKPNIKRSINPRSTLRMSEEMKKAAAFRGDRKNFNAADVIRLLKAGENKNARGGRGVTILHCAISAGNVSVVRLLLYGGGDKVNVKIGKHELSRVIENASLSDEMRNELVNLLTAKMSKNALEDSSNWLNWKAENSRATYRIKEKYKQALEIIKRELNIDRRKKSSKMRDIANAPKQTKLNF